MNSWGYRKPLPDGTVVVLDTNDTRTLFFEDNKTYRDLHPGELLLIVGWEDGDYKVVTADGIGWVSDRRERYKVIA